MNQSGLDPRADVGFLQKPVRDVDAPANVQHSHGKLEVRGVSLPMRVLHAGTNLIHVYRTHFPCSLSYTCDSSDMDDVGVHASVRQRHPTTTYLQSALAVPLRCLVGLVDVVVDALKGGSDFAVELSRRAVVLGLVTISWR